MTLAANLAAVRLRVDRAARVAGRDPADVGVVAVSKYHRADDVRALVAAGQTIFGESREQDLRAKRAELSDLTGLGWHFLGRLQTNKARAVGREADLVHSLDRAALIAPLARGAGERPAPLPVLIQISLDGDPGRGGAAPGEVAALAAAIAGEPALRLAGVMAVAAPGLDAAPQFARLREIAATLAPDHPAATTISAGMSGDLEAAIEHGATLVRVGSALFGARDER